jgi:GNAT superfamily N-acetyltransferase
MNVIVRPAQKNDAPALRKLADQLGYQFTEEAAQTRLETLLSESEHIVLVAETDENEVVGWAHGFIRKLLIHDAHIEIGGMVVGDGHRGMGIGQTLLVGIEDWAREMGFNVVFLRSNIIREEAHRFYEKAGYEHTKTSKIFWKNLE